MVSPIGGKEKRRTLIQHSGFSRNILEGVVFVLLDSKHSLDTPRVAENERGPSGL